MNLTTRLSLLLLAGLAPLLTVEAAPGEQQRVPGDGRPVTRHYATVDGLQIHYRRSGPEESAGDSVPVVALHQSPNSGQVYVEFMSLLGRDRVVVAPDTPGFGQSDRPPEQPAIGDYARLMEGLAEVLELGPVDVVGYHTGAATAIEWALRHPERVRRLWLVGVPAFDEAERERLAATPWPSPAPLDAERVAAEWQGSKAWQGPGQSDESVERTFLAKLGSGRTGWWGAAAVFDYPLLDRLSRVSQPLLVTRPRDDLWDITPRVRSVRPDIELQEMEQHGFAVFEAAPALMAATARRAFPPSASPPQDPVPPL